MLNVCIDVDLTLIDEQGELLPGAIEALTKLREVDNQRVGFTEAVLQNASRLNDVLRQATNKKLVLVADFRVRNGNGGYFSNWSLLCEHCPVIAQFGDQEGDSFPVLRGGSVDALTSTVLRLRYEIREYLASAQPIGCPKS
jgi:hypothetical protein